MHFCLKILNKLPIVKQNDQIKVNWDGLIIILALYNCFSVPVKVAFSPDTLDNLWFLIFDILIDICFFTDILIGFRTTYYN